MRPMAALCVVALLSTVCLPGIAAGSSDTATVDRIGDGYAVVLLEDGGETGDRRLVAVEDLPGAAREEGAVVRRTASGYEYDRDTTTDRHNRLAGLLDELSERL